VDAARTAGLKTGATRMRNLRISSNLLHSSQILPLHARFPHALWKNISGN